LVRFSSLNCGAIGAFAGYTELYLCERDAGLHPQRSIDIFHHGYSVCNQQLNKMWKRQIHISPLSRPLYSAANLLPGGEVHVLQRRDDRDINGVIPRSRAHLSFTAKEDRWGQDGLQALGLPPGAPFVCVYGRDEEYKGRSSPDFDQHNSFRNVTIHNVMSAAEELVKRGYFVIRMGAAVSEALRTTNPMIIDYATKARSAFMDIYLCARCKFFLGDTAGLSVVPRLFRRPIAFHNYFALASRNVLALHPGELLIPKKVRRIDEHRLMTFREFLETFPGDSLKYTSDLERAGVECIENTPEEILSLAIEMDERRNGTWQTTQEDEDLQRRFWSLLDIKGPVEESLPRMGAEFLRQNQELLD